MIRRLFILLFLIALGAGGGIAHAQKTTSAPDKTRILIILDCSQSMWDRWQSNTKIKITQQVLLRCLDSLQQQPNIEVALRVFGHLNKESFASRLEVPFEANNYHKLQDKIKTLVPNGGVTAASALTSALNDFPADNHARNIILVITDGLTDSEDNICDIARQLQLAGTVAQTFITGIGSPDNFPHRPDCSVQFAQLPNEEPFYENLQHIFLLSDQKAQLTIALLDSEKKPYETDVPVVFYDSHTLTPRYTTLYHYGTTDPSTRFCLKRAILQCGTCMQRLQMEYMKALAEGTMPVHKHVKLYRKIFGPYHYAPDEVQDVTDAPHIRDGRKSPAIEEVRPAKMADPAWPPVEGPWDVDPNYYRERIPAAIAEIEEKAAQQQADAQAKIAALKAELAALEAADQA